MSNLKRKLLQAILILMSVWGLQMDPAAGGFSRFCFSDFWCALHNARKTILNEAPGQAVEKNANIQLYSKHKSYCFTSYCSKVGRNDVTVENDPLTQACFPELGSLIAGHLFIQHINHLVSFM